LASLKVTLPKLIVAQGHGKAEVSQQLQQLGPFVGRGSLESVDSSFTPVTGEYSASTEDSILPALVDSKELLRPLTNSYLSSLSHADSALKAVPLDLLTTRAYAAPITYSGSKVHKTHRHSATPYPRVIRLLLLVTGISKHTHSRILI
jgi:hypothetical protein